MQHSESKQASTRPRRTLIPSKMARYLFYALAGLLLLWLAVKVTVIGLTLNSLLGYRDDVEQLTANGMMAVDAAAAEQLLLDVRQDVLTLKQETAVFMPMMPRLGWVPLVGPTLAIAPELMEMADAGTETAAYAVRGLGPALTILQGDGATSEQLPAILEVVSTAEADILAANVAFDRVIAARQQIGPVDNQPELVQSVFRLADEWLPIADDGLILLTVLPEMAGADGAKSYLILAQNEDELRATGGFISGAGVLTVENGRILSLDFEDAYRVDNFQKPYNDPPQPLQDIMGLDLFVFRDANFWPDFPTSAEQAMDLYSYGQDLPPLDGAIAFDQQFLQMLLRATGPVDIVEEGVQITSGNIRQTLQDSWAIDEGQEARDWVANRKDFLGTFAAALQQKLFADFGQLDLLTLVRQMSLATEQKRLQLHMRDPSVAAVLDSIGWNGRLHNPTSGDFLMIVDTNVGFNKANVYIERQLDALVTILPDNRAQTELTLTYQHTGTATGAPCDQTETYLLYGNETPTYLNLANRCFWNYLRLYTPPGTDLLASSGHAIAAEQMATGQAWVSNLQPAAADLPNWAVFANLIQVPQGTSLTTTATLRSETAVQPLENGQYLYSLFVPKQGGTPGNPINLTVQLPEGATVISSTPDALSVDGNQVRFQQSLESDLTISLVFSR